MEFVVYKTTDDEIKNIRHFSTIADLISFKNKQKYPLIITSNPLHKDDPSMIMKYSGVDFSFATRLSKIENAIEIYDGYRE